MMIETSHHVSVMLPEVVRYAAEAFESSDNFSILDCTLGGAGHSEAILNLDSRTTLVGLDRDEKALRRVEVKLADYQDRTRFVHANFSDVADCVEDELFGFILADLGLSSDQLDDPSRGFSFRGDAELDMRLDQSSDLTAAEIVNEYSESQLVYIFKQGGVRLGVRQIAQAIIQARPLNTTSELEAVVTPVVQRVRRSKDRNSGNSGSHPSTVVFQAIRMAVNEEMPSLKKFLEASVELVADNGIIAVISFHSGEDKLVAQTMRRWSRGPEISDNFPLHENPRGRGVLLTKKAILPSEEEQETNPRARSARLRIFQKGATQ